MSPEPQRWVALARILRPRGNKGEVAAELLTDFPERLTQISEVFLRDASGNTEPRPIPLKLFWIDRNHRGQGVFHFQGFASIPDAERLRGLYVLLPIEQRVTLPRGQYFVSDLIGCSVFEGSNDVSFYSSSPCSMSTAPVLLGTVSDIQLTGQDIAGTPLLVVDTPEGELLVPLADDICTCIDPAAHRIDVALPEGLRSLNR